MTWGPMMTSSPWPPGWDGLAVGVNDIDVYAWDR